MNLDFDIAVNAVKWMAILCRVGAFIFSMPLFEGRQVPGQYKMLFISALCFLLLPFVPSEYFSGGFLQNLNILTLSLFILSEVIIGLIVSLVFQIILEVFRTGGFMIDRGIGLMMAQQVDPTSQDQGTLFSNFLIQLFIVCFLIFDGHHTILRIAAASFKTLPPGSFFINRTFVSEIISFSGTFLIVGTQIAIPVMTVNLLLNIAMGLLARVGEDFPVMMLSFPIRFALGFIIMLALTPIFVWVCNNMNRLLTEYLAGISGLL
ncbi:MAG: flagellar biosynthetic protein FliR [Victivallales bacterium]|nr:flagellar biosynthetic protein FliR [Victivallales bacterium]